MKLTKCLRNTIIARALKDTFEHERAELENLQFDLANEVYNVLIPQDLQNKLKEIPADFIYTKTWFNVKISGYTFNFTLNKELPLHYNSYNTKSINNFELKEKCTKYFNAQSDFNIKWDKVKNNLHSLLYSVTTLAKLETIWPEGKKFYEDLSPGVIRNYLPPAIRIDEINKALRLV